MEKNKWIKTYVFKKTLPNNTLEEFENIDIAKKQLGLDNNIAFDFSLAEKVVWELNDKHYLSFTVSFNSKDNIEKFIDNKHFHDKENCYLPPGVELILNKRNSLTDIYIDHLGRHFISKVE